MILVQNGGLRHHITQPCVLGGTGYIQYRVIVLENKIRFRYFAGLATAFDVGTEVRNILNQLFFAQWTADLVVVV